MVYLHEGGTLNISLFAGEQTNRRAESRIKAKSKACALVGSSAGRFPEQHDNTRIELAILQLRSKAECCRHAMDDMTCDSSVSTPKSQESQIQEINIDECPARRGLLSWSHLDMEDAEYYLTQLYARRLDGAKSSMIAVSR